MKIDAPLWIAGALLWAGFAGMLALVLPPMPVGIAFIVGVVFWWVGRKQYVDPWERKREKRKEDHEA